MAERIWIDTDAQRDKVKWAVDAGDIPCPHF